MLYNVITTILWLVFGFAVTYLKTKTDIINMAKDMIVKAEVTYANVAKSGSTKMQFCIDNIMKIIPEPLKLIFTREMVAEIIQNIFESIDRYAKTQLDKITDKAGNKR